MTIKPGTRKVALQAGLCDGCKRCVEACERQMNKSGKRGKKKPALIRIISKGQFFYPVLCRNCSDAPCVTACMTGCRTQGEYGVVTTDYKKCVGCWMCIMSCPFGAIIRDEKEHIAWKCEGCTSFGPAPCVAACSRGILSHADMPEFSFAARRESAERFLTGLVPY